MRKAFLTLFYSGLSPIAPGTVGSFVALILGIVALEYISLTTMFLISLLVSVIAVKEIDKYELEVKEHDSKEIVIDEFAGMWIALSIASVAAGDIIAASIAFITFRLFDIWKPSIIGKIDEKVEGGWGVMGDDMIAGFFAGLVTSMICTMC
jgi:phosphatidylglycerophosphatase A